MVVSAGVIVLRYTDPGRRRPFRTPLVPLIPMLSIVACGYLIWYLPGITIIRFVLWLAVGLVVYFLYGYPHSRLNAASRDAVPSR
jgi:APA family basic amino acid/polyamine antiporter